MRHSLSRSLSPVLLLVASAALAGPAADNAQSHFRAIAGGRVESLLEHYADGATLEWIGGPLDGRYAGKTALNEVWSKFVKAQGDLRAWLFTILHIAYRSASPSVRLGLS